MRFFLACTAFQRWRDCKRTKLLQAIECEYAVCSTAQRKKHVAEIIPFAFYDHCAGAKHHDLQAHPKRAWEPTTLVGIFRN